MLVSVLVVSLFTTIIASAEQPVTIRVLAVMSSITDDLETLDSYKKISEEANVNIEWEYVRSGWDEKKPLVLASGDLPDVFFGRGALTTADIISNLDYFLPLDDLIDQYGTNIKKMFEEMPETKNLQTFPDGKIYALGHVMPFRPSHFGAAFINQVWLDRLGLEAPTTTDEFIEVMRAFRDKDPNGNGIADEIPMIGFVDNTRFGFRPYLGAFGASDSIDSWRAVSDDGTVEFVPATEGYKQWIIWLNQLYSEGLLDNEALTMDWAQYLAKLQVEGDPIFGMTLGWRQDHINANYRDQYVQLLPLKGPNGDQVWPSNYTMVSCGTDTYHCMVLTINNKNPEATMRWADLFYDDENGLEFYLGPIGTSLEVNEDGTYSILEPADPSINLDDWIWKNTMGDLGPCYVSQATQEKVKRHSWITGKLDLDEKYKPFYKESRVYPHVMLERSETDEIAAIETDINRLVIEKRAIWVSQGGVEDEWDQYINDMTKMGLNRYLEIYQNKLDERK
jgi:putative aldouronate transport system substrate-binding protein